MSIEYIEPTREGRRNLVVLIVITVIAGATIKLWLLPALFSHIDSLPKCDQIRWLRVCLIGISAAPPLITLWSIPYAIRLLKLNQSPLPGSWVFLRTPIKRGLVVRLRAFGLLSASALALAIPVIGVYALRSIPFAAHLKSCA